MLLEDVYKKLDDILKTLKIVEKKKIPKTDGEIILEALRYCRHRWDKHKGCGIHKCLNEEDIKRLNNIIELYEE